MIRQDAQARPYDPLWNDARPRRKGGWSRAGIAVSLAVHAGLIWYVYEAKFAPVYRVFEETALEVELRNLPKPPPPPPPETPPKPEPIHAKAPILDVREAVVGPGFESPITLPISPTPPMPPPIQAAPEPAASAPRLITRPNWSSRPSADDMARYYPERALRLNQNGAVTLQCQVTAKGTVTGCSVLAETPEAFGFGQAAISLSRLFKMKPQMEDGQAVEGASVRIPIAFRLS